MFALIVLTIALNFGFGFVMAVGVPSFSLQTRMPRFSRSTEGEAYDETVQDEANPEAICEDIQVDVPEVSESIPEEWFELLEEADAVESKSFVEASVQVLRLEVGRYRDELIALDDRVRQCLVTSSETEISKILEDLRTTNQDWIERQVEAAGHLSSRADSLGEFSKMGSALENILLEQQAQIETTCSNIKVLDFSTDVKVGCKRLIVETCKLLDMAHSLRDRMQESLMAIMAANDGVESLDKNLQTDGLTGLINRTGLEAAIGQWWRDDPNRRRQLSLVLIDIDRFGRINEQFGAIHGDHLIVGLGNLIAQNQRQDRIFDLAARCAGQRFALFHGDTGPQEATSWIERIRQTIEASTFEMEGEEIELTVSCGVTEVGEKDTTESLLTRLNKAVRKAKQAGRNCTFLDQGEGPHAVEPPEFNVKPRSIRVS